MSTMKSPSPAPEVLDLAALPGVACPCGIARRGFHRQDNPACSLHLVEISQDSRTHHHRKLTEVYYVLEGEGWMELDGVRHPLRPGLAVLIPPGTRHRAVPSPDPAKGPLKVLNFVTPRFDPADEVEDAAG